MKSAVEMVAWPFRAAWLNLKTWGQLFRCPVGVAYSAGDVLVVSEPLRVNVLTYWNAPFTGGFGRTLPEGTRLVVTENTSRWSKGVPCRPEDLEGFERRFLSEEDRKHPKYAGCALVLLRGDVAVCQLSN